MEPCVSYRTNVRLSYLVRVTNSLFSPSNKCAIKKIKIFFKKLLTSRQKYAIIITEKRKGETTMTYVDTSVRLHINYSNRTLYRTCASAWSGNLIAWAIMRDDKAVETIYITDTETGELLKTYKRG